MEQTNKDFSSLWKSSKTPGQIETGTYTARMNEAKLITTKSGHDMMVIEFLIVGGAYKNQKVSKFYGFDERGMGYLKQDLDAMGKSIPDPDSIQTLVQSIYDLCPLDVEVYIQTKADKTGVMRTNTFVNGLAKDNYLDEDTFTF